VPWFTVPFDHPETTQLLINRFEANGGIPHLAIISPDGTVLEVDDAIAQVKADPVGQHFPWPPKPLSSLLPDHYCRYNSGGVMEQIPKSALENKYLLLYFAAHWSAPCQQAAPKLEKIYANLKQHRNVYHFVPFRTNRRPVV
jgi:thiol-disulfide isomerase/thioredoxin